MIFLKTIHVTKKGNLSIDKYCLFCQSTTLKPGNLSISGPPCYVGNLCLFQSSLHLSFQVNIQFLEYSCDPKQVGNYKSFTCIQLTDRQTLYRDRNDVEIPPVEVTSKAGCELRCRNADCRSHRQLQQQ